MCLLVTRSSFSLALTWAETLGAQDVFIGVNALDYSGYRWQPHCRGLYQTPMAA
jgi:7-cyano-7-deazaguanine synthase in queuosine biosynthesis